MQSLRQTCLPRPLLASQYNGKPRVKDFGFYEVCGMQYQNSRLDSEKAWPKRSKPFAYGYGKVPKNFSPGAGCLFPGSALKTLCSFQHSAAGTSHGASRGRGGRVGTSRQRHRLAAAVDFRKLGVPPAVEFRKFRKWQARKCRGGEPRRRRGRPRGAASHSSGGGGDRCNAA